MITIKAAREEEMYFILKVFLDLTLDDDLLKSLGELLN